MADSRPRSKSPRSNRDQDRSPRRRSYSPRRDQRGRNQERPSRPRGHGGFRWKDKRPRDQDTRDDTARRLERGYRNRSRSPRHGREHARPSERKPDSPADVAAPAAALKFSSAATKRDAGHENDRDTPLPRRAPEAVQDNAEPIIVVHVNDRLGTRAAIPCLASDPIRLFKAQVAARIGRQPYEIMLKRQGERPFKDQLTLEDYGVSNGVQIDLEIDTGE